MGAFGLRGGAALQGSRTHLCPASSRPKAAGTCCFRVVFPQEHSSFRVNCPLPPPHFSSPGAFDLCAKGGSSCCKLRVCDDSHSLDADTPMLGRTQLAGPPPAGRAALL